MTKEEKCDKHLKHWEKEVKLIPKMIEIYCRKMHKTKRGCLCEECQELKEYALFRLSKCPFKVDKKFCSFCKIHCYKPDMREKIKNKEEYLYSQSKKLKRMEIPYSKEVLFSLKNIGYFVKKREILKDISFDIHKGERILILGENGCGKTTLSKLIAKIIKPTSGVIIQSLDTKCKRGNKRWFSHIGVIYQNPSYELFMPTVYKEIMFASKGIDIANEVLSLFGLMDLKDRHPQSLSEGQKRKLTVALALASMPEVILLDEPTVGQDYESLEKMIHILNEWHKKYGTTMITVTHDIRFAYAFSDKAIWIEDGVIKRIGKDEVINEFFKIV